VGHKKDATLFATIALAFLERLLCFCTNVNRNQYSAKELQNLQLRHNWVLALPGKTTTR